MKEKLSHIGEAARSLGLTTKKETDKTSCKHAFSRNSMLEKINDIDASLFVCYTEPMMTVWFVFSPQ